MRYFCKNICEICELLDKIKNNEDVNSAFHFNCFFINKRF